MNQQEEKKSKRSKAQREADKKYETTTKKANFAQIWIKKEQKELLNIIKKQHDTTLEGALDLLIKNFETIPPTI